MWEDEIVEEVRKVRDKYAAKFNYDLRAAAPQCRTVIANIARRSNTKTQGSMTICA